MSMNDAELEKILKAARVPEWPDEYWQNFPRSLIEQLKARAERERRMSPRRWNRLAWACALGMVVLLLGAIGWFGRERKNDSFALLQNEKMLREVLTLFPNRIRAIVQNEHVIQLVLSEQPDVPNSPPLWVKFCDRRKCLAFVTFSGQELQLAGERVQVLADARGGVMLVGERLFWSSAEQNRIDEHVRIEAHSMGHIL